MTKIAEQAPVFSHTGSNNHPTVTKESAETAGGDLSETVEVDSFSKSPLAETKDSLLGYLNSFLTLTWLSSAASKTKTVQNATAAVKATKVGAQVAAQVGNVAQAAKNIKLLKSIFTWVSRGAKALGVVAAPFTGGTSLAVGLAAGIALDIVAGEAIDAGITYANGGKRLEESKGDWITIGDMLGEGMHKCFA